VSRRGVFPFRGSFCLEACFDGEVAPEIVQPAGSFDEGVLKARFEVAINVTDATEDLDSDATVLDAHPHLGDTPRGTGSDGEPTRWPAAGSSRRADPAPLGSI
jgi:hypothetical protein